MSKFYPTISVRCNSTHVKDGTEGANGASSVLFFFPSHVFG